MPKLADRLDCTGCTACMSVCPKQCISMDEDERGFLYPKVDIDKCVECKTCEKVCPMLSKNKMEHVPQSYAAFSRDESMRMESSSGGIFSELARVILGKNGVVYGAAYNDQFEVYHYCVQSEADLKKLRGAKYAQSSLKNTFKEVLDRVSKGQYVLFSGTPCQVAGLKSFLKKDYEQLICVDFVCHGVPSPMAWKKYVEYRALKDNDGELPLEINLRSKKTGWSKYQYSNVFHYKNEKDYSSISSRNLFMKLFVGDYLSRPSCSNCLFKGYTRCSDITLGDFWGIWDIMPEMDDNKGTSVVLVQSEKGKSVWEKIEKRIIFKPVTLEEASSQNQSMLVSSQLKNNSEEILNRIKCNQIEMCESLFEPKKPTLKSRIVNKVIRMINTIHTF